MNHLADWTAYWARRTPEATALYEPLSGRRWTYWHLDRRANRLPRALSGALGVGQGDRVAVLAHNRGEHFEALFACAKLGAIFAPLNWRLATAEVDGILADAQPQVLLYDRPCAELAGGLTAAIPHRVAYDEPSAGGRNYEQLLAAGADAPPSPIEIDFEDPVILMYSSGTTGRPKGVLMSHRQLIFNSLSTHLAIELTTRDSTLDFMPMFHTGGLNCLATPILHNGGKVVIMPSFDAERSLQIASDEKITLHMGVPTIFQMWRDAPNFDRVDFSSTRMALCGGAPCPLPLIDTYRERGVLFRQGYGLTEVGPNCFSLTPEDTFRKAGSVGWPNFYVQAKIVDDAGQPVPVGEVGELALGGPMVTIGYFRNADATQQAFRGTRFFHTGDLVRRDEEGYHYIVDRKKDMFISGGENIYPAEVELQLAQLAGVAESCVIGVPDMRWGEVGRAVVVAGAGAKLDQNVVLQHLSTRLARYKIPKSVVFTDALPRNSTGKILRQKVRERFGA